MNIPEVTHAEYIAECKRIGRGEPGWSQVPCSQPPYARDMKDPMSAARSWVRDYLRDNPVRPPRVETPAERYGLTPQQSRLLAYLREQITVKGYCPSYEEMKEPAGQQSKSGVYRLVRGLAERGAIRVLPGRERSIEVV